MQPLASPSTPLTLVGRDREFSVLSEHLTAALAGQGGLVLIGGEAGIGKTALAEAVCREAAEQGALILTGRCYDLTETPPYGPWVELFRTYTPGTDLPPLPAPFAQRGTVGAVGSQVALFQQALDFFAALARCRPLVLLLDDLHWVDPASLDLLRSLSRTVARLPVLLLVTYRADELTRRHPLYTLLPLLERESGAIRLDLRRLSADAVRALVAARYPLPDAERDRLVAYLLQRAEGNAFFTLQLLRALEESDALRRDESGWVVGDLDRIHVPLALRQVIDGRLAQLSEEAQRMLAVAVIIGQEVPLNLWATVTERAEDILLEVVEQAMGARIVEATEDGTRVRFLHALIREALYEGILPPRRRRIHRHVGEVLAAATHPDPDVVAHHFQVAGDARAAAWLVRAGEAAQRAYAWVTAAERFEAAIALMERDGGDEEERAWLLFRLARLRRYADPRRGLAYLDEAQHALAANNAAAAAFIGLHRGVLRYLASDLSGIAEMRASMAAWEALQEADRSRMRERARWAGAPDPDEYEGTVVGLLAVSGRFAEARERGERFAANRPETAEARPQEGSGRGDAYLSLGFTYTALGLPVQARRAFAQAAEVFRSVGHISYVGYTALVELWWVVIPYFTDRVTERHRLAQDAAAAYTRATGTGAPVQHPRLPDLPLLLIEGKWDEAMAVWAVSPPGSTLALLAGPLRGTLAVARGESALAEQLIREALPDGADTAPGTVRPINAMSFQRLAAHLALAAGDTVTARTWFAAHDRWLAWTGAVLGQSEGRALWAQYYRQIGDAARAYGHAERALAHASEPRQPLALLAAHRLLGELDTDARRFDSAQAHLDAALSLADACEAPYERALTLLAIATLRVATGEHESARTLLDEAKMTCERLGAQPALARADALIARLSPAPSYPAGLSAREVEVLRLVAQGMTDRQVAEQLFLSPRTVNQHLRSIYNKLGVSTRAAATHFAVEQGIA